MADAVQAGQEALRLRGVPTLPRCRMDTDRQADRIDSGVQFGRQPAPRTADRGSFSPPFAPLASA